MHFPAIDTISVSCVGHVFLTSTDGHIAWVHMLAVVLQSTWMNWYLHSVLMFCRHITRRGTAGSCESSSFSFSRNHHSWFLQACPSSQSPEWYKSPDLLTFSTCFLKLGWDRAYFQRMKYLFVLCLTHHPSNPVTYPLLCTSFCLSLGWTSQCLQEHSMPFCSLHRPHWITTSCEFVCHPSLWTVF